MKHFIVHLLLLTALVTLFSGPSHAETESLNWGKACDRNPAKPVPLIEGDTGGKADLCVFANRIKGSMRLKNLTPGYAYTVWWVYFDTPSACVGTTPLPVPLSGGASGCDFDDFGGDRPQAVFGRMDSGIAPRNGRLRFNGRFRGMQPSARSEVWLLVFGHGAAAYHDGSALARQLLTPEDPGAGIPHLGNNIDGPLGYPIASAVFKIK